MKVLIFGIRILNLFRISKFGFRIYLIIDHWSLNYFTLAAAT